MTQPIEEASKTLSAASRSAIKAHLDTVRSSCDGLDQMLNTADASASDGSQGDMGMTMEAARQLRESMAELETLFAEADAPKKTEGGKAFSKGDYAYTPSDMPSSWKLRLTSEPGGPPDPAIVGAAAAALSSGGYRGQPVDLPSDAVAGVKAKVRAAWHKANSDKSADDMPASLHEATVDDLVELSSDLVPIFEQLSTPTGLLPLVEHQPLVGGPVP